jgi:hypothetical protein
MVAPKDDIEQVIYRSSVELKTECEFVKSHSKTFCQIVCAHMQLKGYNKPAFEQKTLLSGRTYDRIRTDQLESPSIETVMAICIGFELGVEYGQQLLEITGHKLGDAELHARHTANCLTLYIERYFKSLASSGEGSPRSRSRPSHRIAK